MTGFLTAKQLAAKFPLADLSALPTANPGGGKPWLSAGTIVVGESSLSQLRPVITTQPVSQAAFAGETLTFNVVSTTIGHAALSYQWQSFGSSWANIVGATSSSYTTPPLVLADSGKQYRCIVTNAFGAEPSTAATTTVQVGMPSSSAIGIWYMSEYDATKKAIPNRSSLVPLRPIVTRNPRGLFTIGKAPGNGSAGGWGGGGFDGMTVTEKFAANQDGLAGTGSRIVFAATANGLRYRTNPTVAAGTYTMVIYAKSNTGSSQDFLMSRNGGSTTETKTATTAWQRFTLEFTVATSTALDLRFMKPSTASGDFVICDAFLWRGDVASLPSSIAWGGHLHVGDNDTESVSCTAGELALTNSQAAYMVFDAVQSGIEFSIYATVKRTAAYTTAGAGRYPFFFTPNESAASTWGGAGPFSLGEFDAEGSLRATFGKFAGGRASPGDVLDLASDAGYHVISMKCRGTGNSNGNTIEVWIDDCILFTTINTQSHSAINWFVGAIGGNNGLSRHKLNGLACYSKYHTEAETKQAIEALISNAAASSLAVTRPKNLIIAEGDSITVGPASNSYAQQAFANLSGTGLKVMNWAAQAGSRLATHVTTGLNVTDRLNAFHLPGMPADLTGRRCIYSILIGANDLSEYASAAAYLTALYAVTDQVRAKGAKVVICTVLPKSSAWLGFATHNTFRASLNAQLRLDVGTKFDAIADFAADATMGPDAAASNTTYYGDGLHPTATGHAVLEPIWRAAVNSLLV